MAFPRFILFAPRPRRAVTAIALGLVLVPALDLGTPGLDGPMVSAGEATVCDRWASSRGSDLDDGRSESTAVATLGTLAALLAPGETGCLPAGDVFVAHGAGVIGATSGTASAPVTIRSGPGGRATIVGGVLLNDRARHVVVRDLDVLGDGFTGNAVQVNGHDIVLTDLDVRHPTGICVGVGTIEAYRATYSGVEAARVTISSSRIHQCGTDPSLAHRHDDPRFSGSHGIYVVNARETRIVDNAIHDNQYRGVQVWPRGVDTAIERNVFARNATHVNVGSALSDGFPWRSSGTAIRNNVMTERVVGFQPAKNPAQVHGYFPAGTAPSGNLVSGNCLAGEDGPAVTGFGIAVVGDDVVVANALASPGSTDLRLAPGSPCTGIGPSWAQPSTPVTELRAEPRLVCFGTSRTVELADVVTTPSGQVTWAYSVLVHRHGAGDWEYSPWFATVANTGSVQSQWVRESGEWRRIDRAWSLPDTELASEVWELRYEWLGTGWQHQWIRVGSCR